jgi:hypothetical protein
MLGENVGEIRGQTIGTRILPDEGHGPRMETTDRGTGTLCGVHVDIIATYIGILRPNGTIEGSGTGVVMTEDGESATFRATGVGTPVRPGSVSWRGALFFETTAAKLSRLNGIAAAFEYLVDESGKSEGHLHEWK